MSNGKTALITGAGRGLGRAFALRLARNGWAVAAAARTMAQVEETRAMIAAIPADSAIAIQADVRDAESVRRMIERTESELGPIDLLVNNAGAAGAFGPAWEADPDVWWDAFETNVRGTFLCCHAAAPHMIERKRGRIVNVASGAGTFPVSYMSGYAASKAAVIRFSETLAAELRPHGIAVFAIQPGTVRTEMAESLLRSEECAKWLPWFADIFGQGKDDPPDEGAKLVEFLASGRGDALSGRFFSAPGDWEAMLEQAREVLTRNLYSLKMETL